MEHAEFDTQADRTAYFDYLRVFATFAVIVLHVSAQNWSAVSVDCLEWQVFNFFDSVVRWGVPVFLMISGSLFLGREVPLKRMYSKYILRMVISFLVWSVIYAVFEGESLTGRWPVVIQGKYHMWFILAITGMYMCLPFIKPIAETDTRMKYYLILAFVFAFVIPEATKLTNDFGNEMMLKWVDAINKDVSNMYIHMVLGYTGYFVLGYYINKTDLKKWQRIIIYVLGILGFAFTVRMNSIVSLKTQIHCDKYYSNFTVNVLFESIAVFTWFKYGKYGRYGAKPLMQMLSKYSFGAYLVHILIIEQLNLRYGVNTLSFEPVFAVVFISVLVFIVSFVISSILNMIPVVKKYMV